MFKAILASVIELLKQAGINAVESFPDRYLDRSERLVAVSLLGARLSSSGCGDYIGLCGENGDVRELYGSRAQLKFELGIYSPAIPGEGAVICTETLDGIISAVSGSSKGLKIRSIDCGQTQLDNKSGMLLCRCTLECSAYLTREKSADGEMFGDFTLRGDLKNGC